MATQRVVAEPAARREVRDERAGGGDQRGDELAALVGAEIHAERALALVEPSPEEALPALPSGQRWWSSPPPRSSKRITSAPSCASVMPPAGPRQTPSPRPRSARRGSGHGISPTSTSPPSAVRGARGRERLVGVGVMHHLDDLPVAEGRQVRDGPGLPALGGWWSHDHDDLLADADHVDQFDIARRSRALVITSSACSRLRQAPGADGSPPCHLTSGSSSEPITSRSPRSAASKLSPRKLDVVLSHAAIVPPPRRHDSAHNRAADPAS